MIYTLGLKELPFKQHTRQIIYVESQYDKEINTLIQIHFLDIYYHFDARGYEFCYLPWQTRKIEEGEEGRYFLPYRNESDKLNIKSDFILDFMVHPENRKNITPSLLYYNPLCYRLEYHEAVRQFSGITISKESFEESSDLSTVLDNIIKDINSHRGGSCSIRFQKVSTEPIKEDEDGLLFRVDEDADSLFDVESKVLLDEIIERIEKLNQKGINTYIIQQMINSKEEKLSRIHITKDYRIILDDYDEMEIQMGPLPKALFFLFLAHPEGIIFKHLPDYREELYTTYKKIKPTYNSDTYNSILKVTDPLDNSINENCARIRAAFVSQFDERLAKYYFVTGKRGEPKKITLPRNLVRWEK